MLDTINLGGTDCFVIPVDIFEALAPLRGEGKIIVQYFKEKDQLQIVLPNLNAEQISLLSLLFGYSPVEIFDGVADQKSSSALAAANNDYLVTKHLLNVIVASLESSFDTMTALEEEVENLENEIAELNKECEDLTNCITKITKNLDSLNLENSRLNKELVIINKELQPKQLKRNNSFSNDQVDKIKLAILD